MAVRHTSEMNRDRIISEFEQAAASLGKNRLAHYVDGVVAALWLRLSTDETEDFVTRLEQAVDFNRYPSLRPLPALARGVMYNRSF